jgi:chorismate-pyruvate lyase
VLHLADKLNQLNWQSPVKVLPASLFWRDWLLDAGSLTQRLHDATGSPLDVRTHRTFRGQPTPSERSFGQFPAGPALIRESHLYINDTPVILARTLMPCQHIGSWHRLLELNSKVPLGHQRLARCWTRTAIEVARIPGSRSPGTTSTTWARRSMFRLAPRGGLLVQEWFLPGFTRLVKGVLCRA